MKGKHATRRQRAQSQSRDYRFRIKCPVNRDGHVPLSVTHTDRNRAASTYRQAIVNEVGYVERSNCRHCHRLIRQVMDDHYQLLAWETEPYVIPEFP